MSYKKENTNPITAIAIAILTALVFSFLFLFLGINHRRDVYNDSKKLAKKFIINNYRNTNRCAKE